MQRRLRLNKNKNIEKIVDARLNGLWMTRSSDDAAAYFSDNEYIKRTLKVMMQIMNDFEIVNDLKIKSCTGKL